MTKLIPYLTKQGASTQLIVDDRPYLIIGGELHNSSSSSMWYMQPIWKRLNAFHLNTVLVPVAWELIESEEGKFDFTLVDELIFEARRNELRLILLWFGTWKNGMSSYAQHGSNAIISVSHESKLMMVKVLRLFHLFLKKHALPIQLLSKIYAPPQRN